MLFRKRKSRPKPASGPVALPMEDAGASVPGCFSPVPGLFATSVSLLGSRSSQQDVLDYRLLSDGQFAAAVCDGMGGLNGGALAARTACFGFFEEYEKAVQDGGEADLPGIARALDRRVARLKDENGELLDGGCTLAAALIYQGRVRWLSVGDSRIGLLREGQMHWLNRLHNYRMELDEALQAGELSREEYEAELPRGHALLSFLGCDGLRYIDCREVWLKPGDFLVLCSDGFFDLLPGPELVRTLTALTPAMTNLPKLLSPFLLHSQKRMDNASAVIVRYEA